MTVSTFLIAAIAAVGIFFFYKLILANVATKDKRAIGVFAAVCAVCFVVNLASQSDLSIKKSESESPAIAPIAEPQVESPTGAEEERAARLEESHRQATERKRHLEEVLANKTAE